MIALLALVVWAPAEARAQVPPAPDASSEAELRLERWLTPATAGSGDVDFSFNRPTWRGDLTGWRQEWGFGVGATVFGETRVPFQASPFFPSGGFVAEAQAKRRFLHNRLVAGAGARWLSFRQVSFGQLSLAYTQPLGVEWARLEAEGAAGANVSQAYFLDGRVAIGVRLGPAEFLLGYRAFGLQCGCSPAEPLVPLFGPVASFAARY